MDDIKDGKSDHIEKVATHERDRDHRERTTKSDNSSPKEDSRNDRETSPPQEDRVDVKKRSRTENENDASDNKKAKVYMTPEAKPKSEISQAESEGVTFTVTIGEDKSTIEDLKETAENPNKKIRTNVPSKAYKIKPKSAFTRAPRAPNGRFKNMTLVLQPEIPKDTKISQSNPATEQSDSQNPTESQKSSESQKPSEPKVPIPPKKLPQNTPKQKFTATSAPVNYLASRLSLDSELPDITVTRGGNMVWRSYDVKIEK